jgi:hypothetical protein
MLKTNKLKKTNTSRTKSKNVSKSNSRTRKNLNKNGKKSLMTMKKMRGGSMKKFHLGEPTEVKKQKLAKKAQYAAANTAKQMILLNSFNPEAGDKKFKAQQNIRKKELNNRRSITTSRKPNTGTYITSNNNVANRILQAQLNAQKYVEQYEPYKLKNKKSWWKSKKKVSEPLPPTPLTKTPDEISFENFVEDLIKPQKMFVTKNNFSVPFDSTIESKIIQKNTTNIQKPPIYNVVDRPNSTYHTPQEKNNPKTPKTQRYIFPLQNTKVSENIQLFVPRIIQQPVAPNIDISKLSKAEQIKHIQNQIKIVKNWDVGHSADSYKQLEAIEKLRKQLAALKNTAHRVADQILRTSRQT